MPQRPTAPNNPSATSTRVEELYQLALQQAEDEEYEEALASLAEARALAPGHIGLYLTAAQILGVELEDEPSARALLAAAERIRPGAPAIAYARADLEFHLGRLEAAEKGFRALADAPEVGSLAAGGVARALVARARALMDRGRYEQALGLLQEAAQWDDTAPAHLNQGLCFHALGNAQAAYQQLSLAIDMDADNAIAYFSMGNLMADCGEIQSAAAAFAQTVTVDPDYPDARHRLATMQAMLGNSEAAANILEAELERDPDCFECHYFLALARISGGDAGAALPHLVRATELRPDDFLAAYNLGGLYASQERFPEALPYLERARQLDPALFADGWASDEQFAAARSRPELAHLAQ